MSAEKPRGPARQLVPITGYELYLLAQLTAPPPPPPLLPGDPFRAFAGVHLQQDTE